MKRRNKRQLITATIIVFTMIGGAFAYQNFHEPKPQIDPVSQHRSIATNGSELFVRAYQIPASRTSAVTSQFTGTLQPRFQSVMGFRVAGKIIERNVDVGQHIESGKVLFRLDPTDFDLQLRMAEADLISSKALLHQATSEERRLSQLRKSSAVSQSEYELALSTKDVAAARLDAAERRLTLSQNQRGYCDLIADQSGQITSIQAEVGQVVTLGQPVLQMMQGSQLEAVVPIPENMLEKARTLNANATFWSKPNRGIPARLRELSPAADAVTRTFDARFQLDEIRDELSIGMTVSIRLVQENSDEIEIPIQAISSKDTQPIVWRIRSESNSALDSHRVEAVPIQVLRYNNSTANIQAVLAPGDQIVSSGVQRIDGDCRVFIWKGQ